MHAGFLRVREVLGKLFVDAASGGFIAAGFTYRLTIPVAVETGILYINRD